MCETLPLDPSLLKLADFLDCNSKQNNTRNNPVCGRIARGRGWWTALLDAGKPPLTYCDY